MKDQVYQIKVTLIGSKPKIWRRLSIDPEMPLADLHKVIQTAMGWTNSHLHHFVKNETFYTEYFNEDDLWDELGNVDYADMSVSDLLSTEKEKIIYEYDFGDGWEHSITLEKILPRNSGEYYPVCLAGKRSCPPEDCGGLWGYSQLLEILKDPGHEEYESYMEWLGGNFDPDHFDIDEVNELLQEEDYGCIEL